MFLLSETNAPDLLKPSIRATVDSMPLFKAKRQTTVSGIAASITIAFQQDLPTEILQEAGTTLKTQLTASSENIVVTDPRMSDVDLQGRCCYALEALRLGHPPTALITMAIGIEYAVQIPPEILNEAGRVLIGNLLKNAEDIDISDPRMNGIDLVGDCYYSLETVHIRGGP